ncbi:hypothetical protein QCA50_017155 [Cerrena zonata]|uniref:Uncharacterized protein n=1 Tax=Cerrena zonata TaxID=2478898 RepID=A0AAW0FJU9_9APHY
MSDNSNGFFGRIFGSRNQDEAYQPVSANQSSTNGTPANPNHMPGYFPLEDTEEQGSLGRVRNYFNSVMVSHSGETWDKIKIFKQYYSKQHSNK